VPKIIKINDKSTSLNGTHYLGLIHVDYDLLISKLGKPSDSYDDYKSDAEWTIEFEDGNIATIYNWKNGKNYNGAGGLPVEQIKEWHIGGANVCVVEWVEDYVLHSWPVFDEVRQEAQY
jgi:hypothetical protein